MNADEPIKSLGRYRIQRVLGRGAMGLVYEGVDPRLDRPVAIKTILKSHLLDATLAGDYSARFVREAQAAGRLSHPNIVSVFDFGEQDDVAYLVMEFIRGRELASHFDADDFFDLPQAVRIMGELLDALGYAHERGVVHRDVKPANVMIESGSGRVKLTDFGVARLADAGTDRTQPGTMVGTPSYMSPEQIQGLSVGSRTDIFAAGVVLYQFLTRQKPFTGGGQWTVQRKIIQDDPTPPSFANRALPPVFDGIVRRALAKDPADRYATAAEFAADLRAALGSVPGSAPALAQRDADTPATVDDDATVIRPRSLASLATLPPTAGPAAATAQPAAQTARVSAPTTPMPGASAASIASAPPAASALADPLPALPATAPNPPAAAAKASAPARRQRPVLWAGITLVALALLGGIAWRSLSTGPDVAPSAAGPAAGGAPPAQAAANTPAASPAPTPTSTQPDPPPDPARPAPVLPLPVINPTAQPARDALPTPPAVILKTEPRPAAARAPTPAPATATSLRCSDLLQRVQLGETLSSEDQQVLQKECRR